jgi:hypothetical protein
VFDEDGISSHPEYEFHRCLVSEYMEVYPDRKRLLHLPKEITARHSNIIVRNDLYDCSIEICTPEVVYFL